MIVLYALSKLATAVTYEDVVAALSATAPVDVGAAILATAGSYGFLAFYDRWALRFVGARATVCRGRIRLVSGLRGRQHGGIRTFERGSDTLQVLFASWPDAPNRSPR